MDADKERYNMRMILRLIILALIVVIGICFMAPSCCVCRQTPAQQTIIKDSVAVHIKDSVSVRDSVVFVQMPIENSQNILPQMLPSHLETSLAESDAWVDSLGLHHTLKNKAKPIEVHVPVTEHFTETETQHETDTTNIIPVEVERDFTWWERFRLRAFWWLFGIAICLAGLMVLTLRKFIFKK